MFKRCGGPIFWDGGVDSGNIAHSLVVEKGDVFWEGGVDSRIRRHLT